jgi:hypothetical protein
MESEAVAARQVGREPASWTLILLAGGAGWLVVTGTALLWLWPMSGKVINEAYYLSSPARAAQHLLVFAISVLAYRIAFSPRFPDLRVQPVACVVLHLALTATVVRLAPFAAGLASAVVDQRPDDLADTAWFWRPFGPDFNSWLLPLQSFLAPYLLGLALIAALRYARDYHRESLRSASLAAAYAEARMAMLTAQLQPHFLFNAMHAISELIHESPPRATVMLARLADFLRVAIENSRRQWVSVATELAGVETYLAIQQVRFRDQLQIALQVDPAAAAFDMLPLLVQPLAENAVEHGRTAQPEVLHVSIAVRVAGNRLVIDVHNNVPRLAALLGVADHGVGLANVSARLAAAYGGDASVQVGPGAAGGTLARLSLPLQRPAQLPA